MRPNYRRRRTRAAATRTGQQSATAPTTTATTTTTTTSTRRTTVRQKANSRRATAPSSRAPRTVTSQIPTQTQHTELQSKILNDMNTLKLKLELRKATIKFEKACRQLILLDRNITDLHNLYTSSMESDRKTFKIVNRMQLATLEGTHEAYIEYIERKVDEIRKLKMKIFEQTPTVSVDGGNGTVATSNINERLSS